MTKKLWSGVLLGGILVLVLSGACFWRQGGKKSAGTTPVVEAETAGQVFVGTWTYVDGKMKSGDGFALGPAGPDGKNERALAGTSTIIKRRGSELWVGSADSECWEQLRAVDSSTVELIPGHTQCDASTSDAGVPAKRRATTVQYSMKLDEQGKAHVTGESKFTIEAKGTVHEIRVSYDGTATREAGKPSE